MNKLIYTLLAASIALTACSSADMEVADVPSTQSQSTVTSQPDIAEEVPESYPEESSVQLSDVSYIIPAAQSRFSQGLSEATDGQILLSDQSAWDGVFSAVLGQGRPVLDSRWSRFSEPAFYKDGTPGWRRDWRSADSYLSERVFFMTSEDEAKLLAESQFSLWQEFSNKHNGSLDLLGITSYTGFYADIEPVDPHLQCVGVSVASVDKIVFVSEINTRSCETTPAPWAETSVLNMIARAKALLLQN